MTFSVPSFLAAATRASMPPPACADWAWAQETVALPLSAFELLLLEQAVSITVAAAATPTTANPLRHIKFSISALEPKPRPKSFAPDSDGTMTGAVAKLFVRL